MKLFPKCVFGVWSAAAVLTGGAGAGSLDQLREDTPFLPRDQAGAGAAAEDAVLEFRGMMTTPAGTYFGLFDKTSREVAWVRQGETGGNFTVSHYDAENDTIAVEHGGRKTNLTLATAVIAVAKPTAPATRPAAGAGQVLNGGLLRQGQAAAGQRGGGTDAARLQAIADEMRALRARRLEQFGGSASQSSQRNSGQGSSRRNR
ncbi:MAG: hypothetical protein LBR12_02630 [Opitutaceae bacterium]|jgi:hypothetical protein|nr:hypothetical protein [Opitutaceae bacterium]